MRLLTLITTLFALFHGSLQAMEPVTPGDAPVVVYKTEGVFDDVRTDLEFAITDLGMKISGVLHISDMLQRTAADTGLDKPLYAKAEGIEFCSVVISYRMSEAHPGNLSTCPLTIGIYTTPGDEEHVYLSFKRPAMLGDARAVEQDLYKMMDEIIQATVE
ncbi:MAG: hypothetical protein GY934_00980 [Gammaproteobacteria bacterium]|nr:hypothetical protein [Gammaproteobacteria bacterium]